MPMRLSDYHPDWPAISRRIRERARNRCERCGKPNGETVMTGPGGLWFDTTGPVSVIRDCRGDVAEDFPEFEGKPVKVVLTVAHLDQDRTNNSDDNLQALCQGCHLRHDAPWSRRKAAETRARRRAEAGCGR